MTDSLAPHLRPFMDAVEDKLLALWLEIIAESKVLLNRMASNPTDLQLTTELANNVIHLSKINDAFISLEAAFNVELTTTPS